MTVLITGGTKGIGLAVAKAFAAEGDTVLLNYARDEAAAQHARSEIVTAGSQCRLLRQDIGAPDGCAALVAAAASECDRLDQIIHCAVRPLPGELLAFEPDAFNAAVQVNGMALFYLVQAALPLLGRGSSIIYLTSRGGRTVIPNYAAIGAGKALAECLMRYLAVELAPRGVRINAVAPAVVATEALTEVFGKRADQIVRDSAADNPSGRGIRDADYTRLIRWLSSDEAEYIQGQVIFVNGGANLSA